MYLNLTQGHLFVNCPCDPYNEMLKIRNYQLDTFKFPGGELQVQLELTDDKIKSEAHYIEALLKSSDDVMELLLSVDALRRMAPKPIELKIWYLPYARQDRVCNPGEALSIRVFCELINSLNLKKVTILDPHSDVAGAILNNVTIVPQQELLLEIEEIKKLLTDNTLLIAPDAGAEKKVGMLSKSLQVPYITASKIRDTKTGKIIRTEVNGDAEGKNFLVVDDICDGGRTFIELAKVLKEKGANELYLYVTHGIFSKGTEVILQHYNQVFTPYNWEKI